MKELSWIGTTKIRLMQFPEDARKEGGRQLRRVQKGLQADDWKPMPTVGSGVVEIRLHEPYEHRIFYIASYPEAIYVLHAFEKKTQQTRRPDLVIGRKNYDYIKEKRKKIHKIDF